jgi:hypothetical protein
MTRRWLYTSEGEARYYQDGDYIYSEEDNCRYYVSKGWWRDIRTDDAAFYVADNWVYSLDGKPTYYFG